MSQPNEGQDHLDYRETEDVTEVHASVLREHEEPKADSLPIPTWLAVLCTASLCWAGAYIGMFHGGFSSKVYNEYESNPSAFFPLKGGGGGSGEIVEEPLLVVGQRTYSQNCVSCHGADGKGSAAIPPLVGSEWIEGAEHGDKRLIAILLKGVSGPLTVKGQTYNALMPAWESLKDRQIAGLATYLRQSFNKGTGDVTEAMVKAVRKEFKPRFSPWSEAELKAIPVDAKIEGAEAPAGNAAAPAASASGSFDLAASIQAGTAVYLQTCLACHQATGQGIPSVFPPLAGTEYVTGDARRLVAIMLKGVTGPITVNGTPFNSTMPPPELSFPILKEDKNIADVLNYVRNNFGNKSDVPVTPELVGQVRKEFEGHAAQWTEAELNNFPPAK